MEEEEKKLKLKFDHKQVPVVDNHGETVKVDEGIVDMLTLIWNHDIDTELSCQENTGGRIWICFPLYAFKQLGRLAVKSKDQSLYLFLLHHCEREIIFDDENSEELVTFSVSLRFHKSLKQEFMDCWRRTFIQ